MSTPLTNDPHSWSAADYAQHGRFVADLAGDVLRLLDAQPGERILDLGCGDGALTERIAGRGCVVLGLDAAPEMVQAARQRGLDVLLGDGQGLTFNAEFDAAFSNAALHWMRDQEAVLAGVFRALRPGGRWVAEMGGHNNIASIRTALRALAGPLQVDAEAAGGNVFPPPRSTGRCWRKPAFASKR